MKNIGIYSNADKDKDFAGTAAVIGALGAIRLTRDGVGVFMDISQECAVRDTLGEDAVRDVVFLPEDERLGKIVRSHADTLVFSAGGAALMNREYAARLGIPERPVGPGNGIFTSDDFPRGVYPDDTRFNALAISGKLFGRLDSLSPDVLKLAEISGLTPVNTKQGYARCAVLPLESAGKAVTADRGMSKALTENGIDVMVIRPGGIALDGCEYGFIGGASVVDEESRIVFFFGKCPADIADFVAGAGYIVADTDGQLTDVGGGIVLSAD